MRQKRNVMHTSQTEDNQEPDMDKKGLFINKYSILQVSVCDVYSMVQMKCK